MEKKNIVSIEDRIPKLKQARKKKANRRLLFYLSIFFLLISVIVYLQSPLSYVKQIEVTGNKVISTEQIIKTSELSLETNIWTINVKGIKSLIEDNPLISTAEVKRYFPWTVQMNVEEYKIIGYEKKGSQFSPILENGKIVISEDIYNSGNGPLLSGFTEKEYLKRMANELNNIPNSLFNLISEIIWEPTEKNKYKIVMYMNDGFIVHSTIRDFSTKMKTYPSIVSQLEEGEKGIVHMGVGSYFEKMD